MIVYRSITPPQALTFDLDDTLYDNHPTIIHAEKMLQQKMAVNFPNAAKLPRTELNAIKRNIIKHDPRLAWDMGKLRLHLLKHILLLDTQDNIDEAAQTLLDYFYVTRSAVPVSQQTHDFLTTLSEHIPLVGITNGNLNTEQAGIKKYFKAILHANITSPAKPDKYMFTQAADILALQPSSILHIGDSLVNDVFGAYTAGFMSAWYAINREMHIAKEKVIVLPDVQLTKLPDIFSLLSQ